MLDSLLVQEVVIELKEKQVLLHLLDCCITGDLGNFPPEVRFTFSLICPSHTETCTHSFGNRGGLNVTDNG